MKAGFEMSQEQQTLLIARQIGEEEQEVVKPVVNKPTVKLCNLRNLYIDPTCNGNLDEAQFVIHSYESSMSELKKAGMYTNLDQLKITQNRILLALINLLHQVLISKTKPVRNLWYMNTGDTGT